MARVYLKCLLFAIITILLQGIVEYIVIHCLSLFSTSENICQYAGWLLGITITILIFYFFRKDWVIPYFKLLKTNRNIVIFSLFFFLLVVVCFAGIVGISSTFGLISYKQETTALELFHPFLLAILVAFSEESLFRGIIFSYFQKRIGSLPSVLFTSLLFSCVHLQYSGIAPFITAFIVATVFSVLTMRYKSLLPAIGFHAGWNFSYFIFEEFYTAEFIIPVWGNLFEIPQMIFLFVISLFLIISLRRKHQ